ncbi:hypothetical protein PAHAL_3G459800 [Panicum hallii]|uniref:Uncharacterized protein n=1 Tax=Panicum hallii TaxID=206008 RepID=A0A2T8KLI0_9POAL|nr:hypothetical protein PAHAL_3G459800 [Panicum hallii]
METWRKKKQTIRTGSIKRKFLPSAGTKRRPEASSAEAAMTACDLPRRLLPRKRHHRRRAQGLSSMAPGFRSYDCHMICKIIHMVWGEIPLVSRERDPLKSAKTTSLSSHASDPLLSYPTIRCSISCLTDGAPLGLLGRPNIRDDAYVYLLVGNCKFPGANNRCFGAGLTFLARAANVVRRRSRIDEGRASGSDRYRSLKETSTLLHQN